MTEIPAEFLEPERPDEPGPKSVRDRGDDGPVRTPRAAQQLDSPDEPYGDG